MTMQNRPLDSLKTPNKFAKAAFFAIASAKQTIRNFVEKVFGLMRSSL